jgi:hypothetical protein
MKLIEYISDKLFNLYYFKSLMDNNNIIYFFIILYLLNPKKIIKKSKKIFNKLIFSSPKNKDEKNHDFNDEYKNNNDINDKIDINDSIDINKDTNNLPKEIKKSNDDNHITEIKVNDFMKLNKSTEINNLHFKKNIKNSIKRSPTEPYKSDKENINLKYNNMPDNHDFKISISNSLCSTPIFTLRTYDNLNFYYNFLIHNFDTQKIYNLNMCRDIQKWMTTSYLSNEDLSDEFVPIYFIYKNKDKNSIQNEDVTVLEYLKFFVHTNENAVKTGFIQKGNDYLAIKEYIDKLIEDNYIKDLLNGEQYINYNLSCNEGTINFLDKFLSLVLIPEDQIGNELTFDISNYYENKSTYEYYMKTMNSDISMFNTSL